MPRETHRVHYVQEECMAEVHQSLGYRLADSCPRFNRIEASLR